MTLPSGLACFCLAMEGLFWVNKGVKEEVEMAVLELVLVVVIFNGGAKQKEAMYWLLFFGDVEKINEAKLCVIYSKAIILFARGRLFFHWLPNTKRNSR